ncbi:MAG: hypothetical protein ACTSVI_08865 [Promethearchaeota archaeon]
MDLLSDYHVHTKASSCCKEDYGIIDAWREAQEKGIKFLGISDHDVPFKNTYLKKHKKDVNAIDDVFLGMEISIRDVKGRIMVSKENLSLLDYKMISEHVHVLPSWMFLYKGRRNFLKWWKTPELLWKIEKFYRRHVLMTENALKRNEPDILAHPWRFPWHAGILDIATIDASRDVLKVASKLDVKIEISRSILSLIKKDEAGELEMPLEQNENKKWKGEYFHEIERPITFFKSYFQACQQEGIFFTLGSDAHRLVDVGNFPDIKRVLKIIGIKNKNIVHVIKE